MTEAVHVAGTIHMEHYSPADAAMLPIEGKIVASARVGRDEYGYDYVSFLFSDGTVFRAQEKGQDGWIWTEVLGP